MTKEKKKIPPEIYLAIFTVIMLFISFTMIDYFARTDPEFGKIVNQALSDFGMGDKDMIFAESCLDLNATLEDNTCYLNRNESRRYRYFMNCDGRSIVFDYDSKTDISLPKKYRDKCTIGREERYIV